MVVYSMNRLTEPKFDSERWKTWMQTESELSVRWEMMNSLRRNHQLVGMTKFELIEMLGEPEWKENENFVYDLGFARIGVEVGYLTFEFDDNGKVSRFYVSIS